MSTQLRKKILIVDDEPDYVDILKMRLEAEGFEVESASDGRGGIIRAVEGHPDLLLLDVLMPELSGYGVIMELRRIEATKSIPVIVLTGRRGVQDLFEVEGVSDYLIKPFDFDDLLLRIKRALGNK